MSDASKHPLGPVISFTVTHEPFWSRIWAILTFIASSALLLIASRLQPNPSGHGTHRQFGQPACPMIEIVGIPCPSCGMTTAFAWAVRGRWLEAFHAQPAGALLALAVAAAGLLALVVITTGKTWRVNWYRVPPWSVGLAVVVVLLGGWAYKIVVTFSND